MPASGKAPQTLRAQGLRGSTQEGTGGGGASARPDQVPANLRSVWSVSVCTCS